MKSLLKFLTFLAVPTISFSQDTVATNETKTNSIPHYLPQANQMDRTKYIGLDGKVVTYEEALPKLKERLGDIDKERVLETVKLLQWYGDSIAGSDVMDALVKLYTSISSPTQQDALKMTKEEALDLELKGQVLIAIVMSGDHRRVKLMSEASNDPHYGIRGLANWLSAEIRQRDHFKRGFVPPP